MKRLTLEDFNSSVKSSVSKLKSSLVPVLSNDVLQDNVKKNEEQKNLSIFIPCFQLNEKRKRNLEFTYNRLSERDFHIVLVVQGDYDEYYNKFTNTEAEVRFFPKDGDFNKSFILNRCLELVKTDFFVFLDADVYFNFDSLSTLKLDDEIVKPFSECTYLTEELTQEFIDKRSIKIPSNLKKISAVGGGALVIRSNLIRSKNLNFDENFTGWGWEDIDFGDQIRSKGLKVRTLEQPAVHLYHESLKPNEYNNSLHYKSKTKIKSKIVHIFSSDNSDLSSINSFVANKTSDVLLINCAKVDQINNPNMKFIYSNRIDSAYLKELASEFVDDQGWIVCTQGSFFADDRFYLEINNKTEDYHVLGQAEGFILKRLAETFKPIYSNIIEPKTSFNWQWPGLTEKQAMHNHQCYDSYSNDLYIGFPWASLIDFINYKMDAKHYDYMENNNVREYLLNEVFTENYNFDNPRIHTVCQSINWERMIGLWKHIGITNVHLSHLTKEKKFEEVSLHPWHLIAPNTEVPKRNNSLIIKNNKEKKYLCSFIGANNNFYKRRGHQIRSDLKDIFKSNNEIYFEIKDKWFYNDVVYEKQVRGNNIDDKIDKYKEETIRYNQVLSNSIFSLCPEGSGPNTFRLWESMSIGVIPVLFESDWVRPDVGNLDWEEFSVTISKDRIFETYDIIKSFSFEKIEDMKINCINAYNYVRTKTCF